MKFLIVDDSPTMLRIIRNALQEIGYDDIVEAEDGEDALEKLEENAPDFVVTDWNMPNMNGVDLTSNIRNHPEYSDLPILMITTRGMKEDVKTAMKAEVNNYIVKPFEPEVLEEKVDSCLEAAA
ncbi:two-component system chemotaxis response regulator CheY [Salinibacter ruber]|mgnify:FL=1|jgi:two-component system chemotaxis response regulator CheY|nr:MULTISPECIES: response regulator [Salinibacter]MBB4068400.1 two-component system chemotaxis response regulator CheY [Salinibacter ruber]MBB4090340.1 two-component system chemotaxis response regulator CheY [Salinibacter ruber]MCS3611761.1 two-component system chemotaxis response regulator CheY [Salinibacter ruber]MCS3613856.1 two-component system chemotaxis response regulator CheY [Salinibacter ruber]MCS3627502.1 two-component system chemotaxis response regulator CheY [Salinibacter ruber]